MRVLFLQDNGINESLGLTEASALLRRHGHQCLLLIQRDEPRLDSEVRAFDPQVVVLPTGIGLERWTHEMAARVKRLLPVPVFTGGSYATYFPEQAVQPPLDGALIGEADDTLLELVEALHHGRPLDQVAGLGLLQDGHLHQTPTRPLNEDLDALPLPHRELYHRYPYIQAMSLKRFITGRGCYNRCSYCFNTRLRQRYEGLGAYVRRKSVGRAIAEINAMRRTAPLRMAHFSDDIFVTRLDWLQELAERFPREAGVPFTCNSTVELITPESARLLARAGCVGVAIGVETGNERLRHEVLGKMTTNDHVLQAGLAIKQHGMKLATFNMVGIPGTTPEDELSTIALNQQMGTDLPRVTRAQTVAGTDFARKAGFPDEYADLIQHSPHRVALERLFLLFRPAVVWGIPPQRVRQLARLPVDHLRKALMAFSPWGEKRFFELGWSEGLRYFAHVGDPLLRTTNSHQLI